MDIKTKERNLVSEILIIALSIVFLIAGLALTIFPQYWSEITELYANTISTIGVFCSLISASILVFTKD